MKLGRTPFVITLLLGSLSLPLAAGSQQPGRGYRVGLLNPGSLNPTTTRSVEAFRSGLRDLGWVEGQNLVIEMRSAEGRIDRLPALASELVSSKVDVLVALTSTATVAAARATKTIPIVMVGTGDPIRLGLVASLARPGGNVTGTASLLPELAGKWLELVCEAIPGASRVAVLWNPDNPLHDSSLRDVERAAQLLGVSIQALQARGPDDFEGAFGSARKARVAAALVAGDPTFSRYRVELAGLALKNRLPTIFAGRLDAEAGGLMAYGPSYTEVYRRSAALVDKILRGAKTG